MTAMEQIAEISCLARDAGMTYGAYISKFGSPFDAVKKPAWTVTLKKNERVCKVCGEVFELKSGRGYSARKTCYECEKKRKVGKPKPMGLRKVKEYAVKCSRCGADMITRRAPSPDVPNYCTDCREIVNRERCNKRYQKQKAGRR